MVTRFSTARINDVRVTFHVDGEPSDEATLTYENDTATLHFAEVPVDLYFAAAGGVDATLSTEEMDPFTATVTPVSADDPIPSDGDDRVLAGAGFEVDWPDGQTLTTDSKNVRAEPVVDDNCDDVMDALRMSPHGVVPIQGEMTVNNEIVRAEGHDDSAWRDVSDARDVRFPVGRIEGDVGVPDLKDDAGD